MANFVIDCIEQAGKDALILAGQQSGYVTLPRDIDKEFTSYLALDQLGLRKVPYWFHINEKRIPPLSYIQTQLNNYVNEKATECLGEFLSIEDKYTVEVLKSMDTKTTFTEKDVVFEVSYPLIARPKTGGEVPMDRFVGDVPIRFKKAYETAKQVMESEIENLYVEKLTLDLMAGNEDVPMDGFDLDCTPKVWPLQEVNELVRDVLAIHIPNIRVDNTAYTPFLEDESVYKGLQKARRGMHRDLVKAKTDMDIEQSSYFPKYTPDDAWEYGHSFWDMGVDRTTMQVNFFYTPEYGLSMRPTPDPGPFLTSKALEGGAQLLSFICVNIFHYVWDVEYPVKVSIYDPESLQGRGYYFDFAFPVTIDNNLPKKQAIDSYSYPESGLATQEFCQTYGGDLFDIRASGFVHEDLPPEAMQGATITYKCGDKRCILGDTKADGGVYRLMTPLPEACRNPYIYADKPGYLQGRAIAKQSKVDIELIKLREMSIDIKKWPYFSADKVISSNQAEIFNDEIMIFLKSNDRDYSTFTRWTKDSPATIELIDDTSSYDVKIMLTVGDTLVGGYQNKNWTVHFNDLAGTDEIIFNIFEFRPLPDSLTFEMANYMFGESYKDVLAPELR